MPKIQPTTEAFYSATGVQQEGIGILNLRLKEKKNQPKESARYSAQYLKNHFQLGFAGSRGGIIAIKEESGKYSLFSVCKEKKKAIQLGEKGSSGKVKKIINLNTGEIKALKVFIDNNAQDDFQREAEILKKLGRGYPYVIPKVYSAQNDKKKKGSHPSIIMDFAPGDELYLLLVKTRINLSFEERVDIFHKVLSYIHLMHQNQILHLDIKSANIKYDRKTKEVSVIDFGFSRTLNDLPTFRCGTRGYVAPEVLKNQAYSTAADVFSLGCLAEELFPQFYSYPTIKERNFIRGLISRMKKEHPEERVQLSTIIVEIEDIFKLQVIDLSIPISVEKKPSYFGIAATIFFLVLSVLSSIMLAGWIAISAGITFILASVACGVTVWKNRKKMNSTLDKNNSISENKIEEKKDDEDVNSKNGCFSFFFKNKNKENINNRKSEENKEAASVSSVNRLT